MARPDPAPDPSKKAGGEAGKHDNREGVGTEGGVGVIHIIFPHLNQRWIERQTKRAARVITDIYFTSALEVGAGKDRLLTSEIGRICPDRYVVGSDILFGQDAHCLPYESSYGLIICSNTLEHLHTPSLALKEFRRLSGQLWLSWTPWWSPFGGHSVAPLHYFGMKGKHGGSEFGVGLFKTTVKETLRLLDEAGWEVVYIRPRYWPKLAFLARWKWTREWATWNVEIYAVAKSRRRPDKEKQFCPKCANSRRAINNLIYAHHPGPRVCEKCGAEYITKTERDEP